jgi:hypothetical protein
MHIWIWNKILSLLLKIKLIFMNYFCINELSCNIKKGAKKVPRCWVTDFLIDKFDQFPRLNYSINQIDGWNWFCSSEEKKKNDVHFIDNQQTLFFGLRELNWIEMKNFCSIFSNSNWTRVHFTSDYQMRIFSSDCYYLNEQNLMDYELDQIEILMTQNV